MTNKVKRILEWTLLLEIFPFQAQNQAFLWSLDKDFKYLAVFEAKMYSKLSSSIKNIRNYSQVSRTIACIINSVYKAKNSGHYTSILLSYTQMTPIKK